MSAPNRNSERNPFARISLFRKLFLGLLIIVLVLEVGAIYGTVVMVRNTLLNHVYNSSENLTKIVLKAYDQRVEERIEAWKSYFYSNEVLTVIQQNDSSFNTIPDIKKVILQRESEWASINESSAPSWYRQIAESKESKELNELVVSSPQEKFGLKNITEIFFANEHGAVIMMNHKTTDYDQSDEEWWQKAMANGSFFGKIEYDDSSNTYGITVAFRVDNPQSHPLGVVKVVYKLEDAKELFEDILRSQIQNSKLITGLTGGRLVRDNKTIYSFESRLHENDYDLAIGDMRDGSKNHYCCITLNSTQGTTQYLVTKASSEPNSPLNGVSWDLYLEYDLAYLLQPLKLITVFLISLGIIFLLLVYFYAYLFFRPISRAIFQLEDVTNRVIHGDFHVRTGIRRKDEIGRLAQHFDQMIEKLHTAMTSREEFLSTATHSLKTPLGIIRWDLEVLLDDKSYKLSEPVAKILKDIYASTIKMIATVSNIIEVNKVEKKPRHQDGDIVNVTEFIKENLIHLRQSALSRNITIELEAAENNIYVKIERDTLREMIQNLISNAVKYSHRGSSVQVILSKENNTMKFTVRDTGVGIPLEDQKNIMNKFYRAKNASALGSEGSGLGLYIVNTSAQKWGGSLQFFSEENKGSVFTLTLPLVNETKS